ncbi:unnamed protein product [Calypogeia fissa]
MATCGSNRDKETGDKFSRLGDLFFDKFVKGRDEADKFVKGGDEADEFVEGRDEAGCSEESVANLDAKAAKWRRLGDLGFEAGLREAGCSEMSVVEFNSRDQCEEILLANESCDSILDPLPVDGRAGFYALVGRRISSGKSLHVRGGSVSENEAAALCINLSSNTNLEKLYISLKDMFGTVKGCTLLGRALSENSAIQSFHFTEVPRERSHDAFRVLNILFKYLEGPLHQRATLEELSFDFVRALPGSHEAPTMFISVVSSLSKTGGDAGIQNTNLKRLRLSSADLGVEMADLLSKNKTLYSLDLRNSLITDWNYFCRALKENETLRELDLRQCMLYEMGGMPGHMEQAISTLAISTLMDLLRSDNTGLAKINLSETDLECWQAQVNEQLRKTTEYRAMLRGQTMVNAKSGRLVLCGYGFAGKTAICKTMEMIDSQVTPSWSHQSNLGWKKLMQSSPHLRQMLYGKDCHLELTNRTRGFDVVALKNQQHLKFIWDIAGQKEYYALHDYLFPNIENSCFLYVSSCRLPPSTQNPQGQIKSEAIMQSECEFWMKFIASNSEPAQSMQQQLPQVRFVLTYKDTLNSSELATSTSRAKNVVRTLKRVFKDVVELCEAVEVVDAHSPTDVERLLNLTDDSLKKILAGQTEYAICEEERNVLARLPASHPFMSIVEFYNMQQEGRFYFKKAPEPIREAVLKYLNDSGEIIFPKRELDLVVANPRWFGVHILGSLINAFKGEEALRQPMFSNCVDVLRPSMTYGGPLPSGGLAHDHGYVYREDMQELLRQSIQTVHVQNSITSDELLLHLGRRLECQNKAITFLTPGFFPRLQVHLRNYYHENGWTENYCFAVDRNLIRFAVNGIEVLVEYSGDIDYFVDILARSSKPYAETQKFVDKHVVKKIQNFCATVKGCQGVLLVEAAIRPLCLKELHLCRDRKAHSVPVLTLKRQLEVEKGYKHIWRDRIGRQQDVEYALDLLEGEGSYTRFLAANQVDMTPDASSSGIDSNLKDNHQSQQLPTRFYPTIEDVGMLPKLDALVSMDRKIPIKIHLMCEDRDGCHRMEGQQGRTLKLNWKAGGYDLPILKYAISLLVASISAGSMIAEPLVNTGWIENLFEVSEMQIPAETLMEIVNGHKPVGQVSDEEILGVLKEYLKIDPSTEWLKSFLKVQDSEKFFSDFGLHKVRYKDSKEIAWLCTEHYVSGLKGEITVESVHH